MRRVILTVLAAGSALAACTLAVASGPADIFNAGDQHEGVWQPDGKSLTRGATYTATTFPIPLRVRPPDALWSGVQLQSHTFRFVQFLHLKSGNVPLHGRGLLTLETSSGRTPSVAATVQRLHATPALKSGTVRATRVAGFTGKEFDATVVGSDLDPSATCPGGGKCPPAVSLAPFLTNHHCGFCGDAKFQPRETQDVKVALRGQLFRFIVIAVRGKTVVIYLESSGGSPKYPEARNFPTFLPYAQQMLTALRFPA